MDEQNLLDIEPEMPAMAALAAGVVPDDHQAAAASTPVIDPAPQPTTATTQLSISSVQHAASPWQPCSPAAL